MREFINQNGQVAGWHVMSAFEAKMIGKAAVLDDPNEATTLYIHHNQTEDVTNSEVAFASREARFGRLIIGMSVARNAERAFRQVADSGEAWNGIKPDVARAFVFLLDEGLQESQVLEVPEPPDDLELIGAMALEVPDLTGPIQAKANIKHAA